MRHPGIRQVVDAKGKGVQPLKISPHLDLIGFYPRYSILQHVILEVISLCAFVVALIAAEGFLSMMPHGVDVLNLSISKS